MRRSLWAAVLGALGLGALLRRRSSRLVSLPSPADELRAKLAESKAVVEAREVDEAGETPVDAVEDVAPPGGSVESRRRATHDRARKAADELG